MNLYKNKKQTLYNWKKKLQYKGCLEREEVSGIKFILWEGLKDFFIIADL